MILKSSTALQITKMICGDDYKEIFPYRSSSNLTDFFRGIDLDYIHDGSTRRRWVDGIINGLNKRGKFKDPDLPSVEMVKVIEQLVNPCEFRHPFTDHEEAVETLNRVLATEGLRVVIDDETGLAHLETKVGKYISTALDKEKATKVVTFSPAVFNIPDKEVNPNLVAVMMPFDKTFDGVYQSIRQACTGADMDCRRADDIWEESAIIQDIFNLIFESSIVIADLTGKNPNVLYEVGIAHTLGKEVIPISQFMDDIPFDLRHHRALAYLNNGEGREDLQNKLKERLSILKERLP